MIQTYQKTYREFCRDINRGQIVQEIERCTNRKYSESEEKSFRISLSCVKNALELEDIPSDAEVGLEFKVPLTNKRIDLIIAGEDEEKNKNVVIVELKQWERVQHTDMEDIVVVGSQQRVHPSWQAYSYGTTLTNFNQYVDENGVNIYTCSFLHDYKSIYANELRNIVYKEGLDLAPAFIETPEWESFAKFVAGKIQKKSEVNLLYEIQEGKIKPSQFLVQSLSDCLNNNDTIELLDDQRIALSNIFKEVMTSYRDPERQRRVIIVKGGAGTGKSLIALKLLGQLQEKGLTAFYVAKSSYIKASYYKILTRDIPNYKFLKTLFRGSGEFHEEGNNASKQFDCLIVDEAHRLTKQTKRSFMFYGENQIREIIHASKVSVFFIDETQQIDIKDFGTIQHIKEAAEEENAVVIADKFELTSQFRCNGSDDYIAWVESILYNKPFISAGLKMDYEIQILDTPKEVHDIIKEKNKIAQSRMLSGDVFPWLSNSDKSAIDISIGDFQAQWNKSNSFAVDPKSIDEVGCIHTAQGMEFEYAGLIIGDDLIYRNGKVMTDYTKHPAKAGEFRRPHQKKVFEEDLPVVDQLIRNTYKVLFTRGQKGLYIYCVDEPLKEYLKKRIEELDCRK